jgi:hypothetical protein
MAPFRGQSLETGGERRGFRIADRLFEAVCLRLAAP